MGYTELSAEDDRYSKTHRALVRMFNEEGFPIVADDGGMIYVAGVRAPGRESSDWELLPPGA
jgi:Fe-S cluster biogenesis protein NfuA